MSQALVTPPAGFDPDAEFCNVTPERFTQVPKESHRAGPHRLKKMLALGVLTLYLSHKTGWKIPNAVELAAEWDEGEDRLRAAIKDIERAGFLVRFRLQGTDGKWRWKTYVSADPATLGPAREYAEALAVEARERAARKADQPAPAPRDGEKVDADASSQVGPDGGFRDSVDRDSVDRHPVDRVAVERDAIGDLEVDHEETKTMGGAASSGSAAAPAGDGMDGEISSEDRDRLNGAVVEVTRLRPGWDRAGVITIIRKALAAGHAPARIAKLFVEVAADPGCKTPGAVLHRLATLPTSTSSAPAAPVLADVAPARKRFVDRTDAQCPKHRGELAHNCAPCKGEATGRDAFDAGPTMGHAAAMAAIRAATGAARARRKDEAAAYAARRAEARAVVFGEPAPAAPVDQLAAVVEIADEPASPIPVPAVA